MGSIYEYAKKKQEQKPKNIYDYARKKAEEEKKKATVISPKIKELSQPLWQTENRMGTAYAKLDAGTSPALPFGVQRQTQTNALEKYNEEVVKPQRAKEQVEFDKLYRSEKQIAERELTADEKKLVSEYNKAMDAEAQRQYYLGLDTDELQRQIDELETSFWERAKNQFNDLDEANANTQKADELNAELQLAKYYQTAQKYNDYIAADDFERYSTDTSAQGQGWYDLVMGRDVLPSDRAFLTGGNIIKKYDDIVDKYGENSVEAKEFLRGQVAYDDGKVYSHPSLYHMSEGERKIYAYIYNKEGQEAAEEYLNFIGSNLEQRRAEATFKQRERAYDDLSPTAKSVFQNADAVLEVARALPRGLKSSVQGIADYFKDEARDYDYEDYERALIAEKYDGTGYGTAIGTSESVGQMTPVIASNFIPYVGEYVSNAILYTSAAGNAKQEMLRNGYTATTAAAYGNAIGLSELLTEKVLGGIPGISKGNAGKIGNKIFGKVLAKLPNGVQTLVRAGIDLAGNAIGESSEERVQSGLVEPFLGNALLGEDNSYNLFSEEADEAAKIGFWSGLVMNVANIGGVIGKADAETKANNLLVDTAKFDSTAVKKARTELADALAKGEVTQEGVNKVVTAVIDEISGIVNNEINEFVSGEGIYSTEGGNFKADNNPFAAVRDSFSEEGRAAFDIAMKGATNPEATARQFEIKYREGELGYAFEVDEDSELTPSMQRAAYDLGAKAAKTVANDAKTEYNNTYTEADNGRKVYLRNGGERTDGTNTGKQVRVVEGSTGRNQSGQTKSKPRDSEAASLTLGKEVSTASFYIPNGSTTDKIYRIAGGETTAMKQARMLARDRGLEVMFYAGGNMTIDGESVRGYIIGNRVFIRADHPQFTADQIMRHEVGHDQIDKGEIDVDNVRDRLQARYSAEELDKISIAYAEAYAMSGSDISSEEIFKEVICDSLGDMNVFDDLAVGEFLSVLKAETEASMREATNPDAVVNGKKSRNFRDGRDRDTIAMENNRFERLRPMRDNLPKQWFSYSYDYFYIYENHSYEDYTVLKKVRITERNRHAIEKFTEDCENGAYGSATTFNSLVSVFESRKGRYSWHRISSGNSGAVRRNDGVAVSERESNNLRHSEEDGGVDRTKVESGPKVAGVVTDIAGKSRTVWEIAPNKYMVKGTRLIKNHYHTSVEAAISAENENLIRYYANSRQHTVTHVKKLLKDNPNLIKNDKHFVSKLSKGKKSIELGADLNKSAFSMVDSDGDTLTEQQAEYFADSKVRDEDGNLLVVYHGTYEKFTIFDMSKGRANMDIQGSFFSPWELDAQGYGPNVEAYYLNIKNPASEKQAYASLNRFRGQNNAGIKAKEYLISQGYDGVNNSNEEYIAFYPEQIKRVSNKTPTSNPDIRYSRELGNPDNLREIWKRVQKMTPMQIANMQLEDIDPLPKRTPKAPSGINAENGKESRFYGSAMDSDNVAEDTKLLIKTVDDIRYYAGISNEETLNEANDRLNLMGQAENNRFFALNVEHATAVDVAEGFILLKRYQDKGDFESACGVARKLREIGTSAGQTVQTFSILGRLTPEGMAVYAQKELDAVREEMIRKHSEVWVEQRKDMFSLSAEEMQFIKDNMIAASKLPDGRVKNILIAKIASMLEEKLPKKVLRQIQAYTRVSMLLNPKTMLRNVLGNAIMMPMYVVEDFVGAGFDKALAQKTGVRTKGVMHFDKKTGKAVVKGVYESYDDFRKHVNTRDIQNDRFELGGGDAFRHYSLQDFKDAKGIKRVKWVGYGVSDMLNAVDRISSFLLDLGDRPFFEFHFTNSINNQLRLNHATEPTADMIRIATTEALQRTWQDDNAYTKAASQIRNMLNGGKSWGIGSIIVPFTKTPTNLTKALIEYSPVGLVKAITYNAHKYSNSLKNAHPDPAVQKAFVDSFAKGVTGTLVMAIAYALANAGLISGGDDDKDKDLAAFEKNIMGIAPYSVTVNGKSYSYDWMQPVGGIFAITADYVQNVKAGNSPKVKGLDTLGTYGKAILNALSAGGNVLFEQSFLQGVSELFGDDGLMGGLISSVANAPTQAIPTALSQIAQLADPYVRTSYVYRDTLSTAANKVNAKLPWERKELAPVVDVLGHDVLAYGGNNSFANVFLNPSNIYSETATDAAKEIYRVYEETGDATVIPRVAPYYFEYDDKRYTFTPHERADYQRATGSANERIVNDLKNTYGYMKLSDEDKAKALALVTDYATANAKYEYLAEHDVKYERDSWMIKAAEGVDNGVTEAEYIVAKTVTKGIVKGLPDNDGETYDNSRSLLIMEAIYSIPNLNDEKRKYLFESFGVGSGVIGYTREGVQNTLSQMRAKTYVPPYKVITIKVPNK